MTLPTTQDILLSRHDCRYILPADLKFEGLVRPQGTETARIRFSRERNTSLDIPLSAESLALLVQVMSSLHGTPPEGILKELARLRQNVGFLDD